MFLRLLRALWIPVVIALIPAALVALAIWYPIGLAVLVVWLLAPVSIFVLLHELRRLTVEGDFQSDMVVLAGAGVGVSAVALWLAL